MLNAIHKESGEFVSAWKLLNDVTWIGLNKDEFISPYSEIGNWEEIEGEVPVIFVNESKDGRQAHFRINHPIAIGSYWNESYEHKFTKENIYNLLMNDEITFNHGLDKYKLKDFKIEDIIIEQKIANNKNAKIADVLIKFKDNHFIIGNGIIIEVQFSSQNIDRTELRTYDRALKGFSCVWIWEKELDKLNNNFEIINYREAINEFWEKEKYSKESEVRDYSKKIEEKILDLTELKLTIELKLRDFEEKLNSLLKIKNNIEKEFNDELKTKKQKLIEEINKEELSSYINDLKIKINNEFKFQINNLEEFHKELKLKSIDKLKEINKEEIIKEITNNLKEIVLFQLSDEINTLIKWGDSGLNRWLHKNGTK